MILYDYQTFLNQKYGGISLYYSKLISNLINNGVDCKLGLDDCENFSFNEELKNLDCLHSEFTTPNINNWLFGKSFPGKGRIYKALFGNLAYQSNFDLQSKKKNLQVKTIKELTTKKYDIFHPTYYSDYYLKVVEESKIPYVITVYDMIHEKFPKLFSNNDEVTLNKKKLCKLATKIITISESTKNDLMKFYDIQNSKIIVIHLGNDWETTALVNQKKEYILYVGDRWNYKNFLPFLKSVYKILLKYDLELICAGSSDFSKVELNIILELGIQDHVKHRKFINLNELKSLYRSAKIFVFPSLYEGFGLPILEAQSQSIPLVCSSTSSFPEVASDGALFFDPLSVDSMSQIITEVILDNKLQEQLVSKGNENVKRFNWNETSKKTNALYEFINNK